jgi:hypothetical protein
MIVVKISYKMATALIGTPHLPNDHLDGGSGSPYSLRHRIQQILMVYVIPIAPVMRPMMLLKASDPPRLRRARQMQMKREAI